MHLTYQAAENTLRLSLDDAQEPVVTAIDVPGYVDVGEGGRLVGVEVSRLDGIDPAQALAQWLVDPVAGEYVSVDGETAYITLSAADEGIDQEQVRAVQATLRAELDPSNRLVALAIPRRGAGFEISYPSGNR